MGVGARELRPQAAHLTAGGPGLRALAGLREQTDDEMAAEDVGTEDAIALSGDAWDPGQPRGRETVLLDLAETDGMPVSTAWLDERGLGWGPARKAPGREGPRVGCSPQPRVVARAVQGRGLGLEGRPKRHSAGRALH